MSPKSIILFYHNVCVMPCSFNHTHTHTLSYSPICLSIHLHAACFGRLEDHCTNLQVTRGRLERLWEEKGSQLDKILQLRVFEHDSEQLHQWIRHEAGSLAYNHTDIGDTLSTAELRRQAFEDFRTRMKVC